MAAKGLLDTSHEEENGAPDQPVQLYNERLLSQSHTHLWGDLNPPAWKQMT